MVTFSPRIFGKLTSLLLVMIVLLSGGCNKPSEEDGTIRLGLFPNLTHAHGLIASHMNRTQDNRFSKMIEAKLGHPVDLRFYTYNAGPGAMEAMFAGTLDATYVGPGPAINAYVKSRGTLLEIVSGAVQGGAGLLVSEQSGINKVDPEDFRGKVIATPQLGNTQDVACRAWLTKGGLRVTQSGGDAIIKPTPNPEQISLLKSGKIDAVWTVEPWLSILESKVKARLILPENDAITTVLTLNRAFLEKHPDEAQALIKTHKELTQWIQDHPEEAQAMVVKELEYLTHSNIDADLIARAWPRLTFTTELSQEILDRFVSDATQAGFYKNLPDIKGITKQDSATND